MTDTQFALYRLQTELMNMMVRESCKKLILESRRLQADPIRCASMQKNPIDSISAFPDGDNLFKWVASIKGVDETVRIALIY